MLAGLAALPSCSAREAASPLPRIVCGGPDEAMSADCTLDETRSPAGPLLTIRRADGGFRRLIATRDGRGVVAADGAEPAIVRVVARNLIEVCVGSDRYRLPATIGTAR